MMIKMMITLFILLCNICSDDGNIPNPMVANDQDDLDFTLESTLHPTSVARIVPRQDIADTFSTQLNLNKDYEDPDEAIIPEEHVDVNYPLWTRDSSVRRSPEGMWNINLLSII